MVDVEVARTLTGRQLKMYALEKFASNAFTMPHFSSDLDELADRYRMIRSHNRRIFRDDDLLGDAVHDEGKWLVDMQCEENRFDAFFSSSSFQRNSCS